MKKVLFIVNPRSGKGEIQSELFNIIKIFNEADYEVSVNMTMRHNHAIEMIKDIDENLYDLIVCSGGDGTLNQVISGMIKYNKNIPLGYIPAGSTNDFANTLKLPMNMKEAAKNIVDGEKSLIDVGLFNKNNYFVYVASFGVLTSVSYNTPQDIKNTFGHFAYVVNGVKDIVNIKPVHVKCKTKENEFEGDYIFGSILNTTRLGGVVRIENIDVDLSDGLFEIVFIKYPQKMADLNKIFEGIINNNFDKEVFDFIKTDEIELEFDENISWSLDGEEVKSGKVVKIKNLNKEIEIIKK